MTSKHPDIALLACSDYESPLVEEKVREAFRLLGGARSVVSPGETVFLKVNAVVPLEPGRCATTHPEVVRAVALELSGIAGKVVIGDSPGGPFNKSMLKRSYERTGMARVAEETGAVLNYDVAETQVPLPDGDTMKRLVMCAPVVDADRLVSLSKLKTHLFMGFTCAIKNLYGVVPGMNKFTYHSRFHDAGDFARLIVDVALAADADFHLVDGVWGMEGNGSVWGEPRRFGLLAAGRDPFAVDSFLGDLLGLRDGFNLPLAAAVRRGVFHGDSARLDVVGDDPEGLRVRDLVLPTKKSTIKWLPPSAMRSYSSMMVVRPYPNPERCVACSKCADICPAHAISVENGTAVVDSHACIRCYCCHELCEYGGIDLERPFFADARRFLSRRRP